MTTQRGFTFIELLQDDNRTLKIFIDKYDIAKANRVPQNK